MLPDDGDFTTFKLPRFRSRPPLIFYELNMIKCYLLAISLVICNGMVAEGDGINGPANIDWRLWENMPVYNGGRAKPLDTFAAEELLTTSRQSAIVDSTSNQSLSPTAFYLTLFFEWSGWDHPRKEQLLNVDDVTTEYSFCHQADRWDKTPLLYLEHSGLNQMLGLPEHVAFVAPQTLTTLSLIDPHTQKSIPFATWGRKLRERIDAKETLTNVELKGLELAQRLRAYQAERMGLNVGILPDVNSAQNTWLSLATVLVTKFDDANDPQGSNRQAQQKLWQARSAFLKGDVSAFNQSSREFREIAISISATAASPPNQARMDAEVAYNHWQPFRLAESFMVFAVLASCLIALRTSLPVPYWTAFAACATSTCVLLVGVVLRAVISGRLPFASMYESVVTVATGIVLIGIIWEVRFRKGFVLAVTAVVSLLALLVANHCSTFLDCQIRPLEPILRSPIWLVVHVLAASLSYAAFAVAMGISNLTLGYYAMRVNRSELTHSLSHITSRLIQVGIVLLSTGMFFGCLWADSAWGRFWALDPKEVWTLITLLCYVAVLRAWHGGRLTERGFAAASTLCFSLVIMTWYGVNFILRTGLHSYGFASGGQVLVCAVVLLQIAYTTAALVHSESDRQSSHGGYAVNDTANAHLSSMHEAR